MGREQSVKKMRLIGVDHDVRHNLRVQGLEEREVEPGKVSAHGGDERWDRKDDQKCPPFGSMKDKAVINKLNSGSLWWTANPLAKVFRCRPGFCLIFLGS